MERPSETAGAGRRSAVPMEALLGLRPRDVRRRLGPPEADRQAGDQRWLVYRLDGLGVLRVRCSPRVASWTLSFEGPLPGSLREAAEAVDLWPELAPDASGDDMEGPLFRRRVEDSRGRPASATASVGPDGITRLAVFDEAPDW